jgi:hypothetical protein
MVDLSHWNFAQHFSGFEAAALILGLEPCESEPEKHRVYVIFDRLALHYNSALERIKNQKTNPDIQFLKDVHTSRPIELQSIQITNLLLDESQISGLDYFSEWLASKKQSQFENQKFDRMAIAELLVAINLKSIYKFSTISESDPNPNKVSPEDDLDPTDLPNELDVANLAFRAVQNGYGNKSDTFKNKLIDYLNKHYPKFKREQIQRIATVANPDKSTGRKKFNAE